MVSGLVMLLLVGYVSQLSEMVVKLPVPIGYYPTPANEWVVELEMGISGYLITFTVTGLS